MNPRLIILLSAVALVTSFLLYKIFLTKDDLEIPPIRIRIGNDSALGEDPI